MFTKKILCIGSEIQETDFLVSTKAKIDNTSNHGLINDRTYIPKHYGYYHTSVVDLTSGCIVQIAKNFDTIIMLDQTKESYLHAKNIITTVRLMLSLEEIGYDVIFRTNVLAQYVLGWKEFLNKNKSFCFYPFLALIDNTENYTTICPKNMIPVKNVKDIKDWSSDLEYSNIRQKMIAGEKMVDRCSLCYDSEKMGFESARQFETLEWIVKLSIDTVDDFLKIKNPLLFEVRPSNKCNIMCRMCDPSHSHLIDKEYKKINITSITPTLEAQPDWMFTDKNINQINFSSAERIYYGGGEPTIMPEFYDFLRKCIDTNNTKFELLIGTNGMKFSNTLINLLDHFNNVYLAFSYDGYKHVNDYIRWLSSFDTMVENSRLLRQRGHRISLQTVFSMWNLTSIHKIFEFYDQEYTGSGLLVQPAGEIGSLFGPYNHPYPELVLDSMKKCQQTQIYYENGRSIKSMVDAVIDYYSNPNYKCNLDLLQQFFEFNDKLDNSRNCKLVDYIPELDSARKLCLI